MLIFFFMPVVTSIINITYFIVQRNDYIITFRLLIILVGNDII